MAAGSGTIMYFWEAALLLVVHWRKLPDVKRHVVEDSASDAVALLPRSSTKCCCVYQSLSGLNGAGTYLSANPSKGSHGFATCSSSTVSLTSWSSSTCSDSTSSTSSA
jgi:hypothetical protein